MSFPACPGGSGQGVRFHDVVRTLMSEVCVPVSRLVEVADIPSPTPRFSLSDGHSSNRL